VFNFLGVNDDFYIYTSRMARANISHAHARANSLQTYIMHLPRSLCYVLYMYYYNLKKKNTLCKIKTKEYTKPSRKKKRKISAKCSVIRIKSGTQIEIVVVQQVRCTYVSYSKTEAN
jgi:hypothetical protein